MKLVEARSKQKLEVCEKHVNYFKDCVCLDHKCQVCLYCTVHGDHKHHRTSTILQIDQEVSNKVKNINDQLDDFDKSSKDITNYLKKDRKELRQRVNKTFDTFLEVLNSQKDQILGDIDQVYKNRITKKIRTECLKVNLVIADSMDKTIMELKSKEFNDPFFMALEGKDMKMDLVPLKGEYSWLKAECQDLNSCLDDDLQQHCKAVLDSIMKIRPIKIDFKVSSPLRGLAEELEPMMESVEMKEAPEKITRLEAPQKQSQSTIPKTPPMPLSDATNIQSVQRRRIKIHVQTPKRLLEIETDVNDCIRKIKNILDKSEGIPTATELVYQKAMLDENSTLLACNIQPEGKLYFGPKEWLINRIR